MGIDLGHFFDGGPYPEPVDHFINRLDIYKGSDICIIIPKSGVDFLEKEQHAHDDYEFIIPSSTMPYMGLGKKRYVGERNKILPFNSGQSHGPHSPMLNAQFTALAVNSSFLTKTAYSVYGKSNISFKHDNYALGSNLVVLLRMFMEECSIPKPGQKLVLQDLSTQIAVNLFRQIDNNMPLLFPNYYTARKNIDKAIEYIRDQYSAEYSLEEAAKIAHLSPYHFIRVFKSHTGQTPYQYLLSVKVEKAKELLNQQSISITDVCLKCGFNSISNFTTFFKRSVGVTPSQYRKMLQ